MTYETKDISIILLSRSHQATILLDRSLIIVSSCVGDNWRMRKTFLSPLVTTSLNKFAMYY